MNVANALQLSRWVERNRNSIVGQNLTQRQLSERAQSECGFKVSTIAIRDVLQAHGIATKRRSETAVKIESLTAERDKYRSWLLRSIDAGAIKTWLLKEMQKDLAEDKQISDALAAKVKQPELATA